ncbi:Cof subfamily protein (haloacid dehalogenase superfamily) [Enterococcus sp. PF1-24]|uniref:Cof-type HAD-IIB family hydrolase n=1 Tax=unclassified Enterococcus TaxID=2608891 RepID=UPI002473A47E|nr:MULTISPECIES: Cof-type HAD-IIB family hydrolase [unclassified Enterococcus]MDH6364142.1 Cof subfamily protein (haloacid dehalogenase superfamily) [Enterococcus sp. PFB1-1]MDH6401243.1 Cof subfamily protein (haloacid dehalogenase superfamily) [Enterococcus sp. PF1-24]
MIKLIATDMDGTFLKSDMTYDREKFNELYEKMKADDVLFVVASGNQYYQLRGFFPQHQEMTFAAENGAFVKYQAEELFAADIDSQLIKSVLEKLKEIPTIEKIICGKKTAYTDTTSDELYNYANQYFVRLERVVDFEELPQDTYLKVSLSAPKDEERVPEIVAMLNEKLNGQLIAVQCGGADIDLIMPGINKANGLAIIGEKFGIAPDEMIAFGDSGNDKEMLQYVGHGFAMANAQSDIKEIANQVIGYNNDSAVLQVIADFAENQWQYPY